MGGTMDIGNTAEAKSYICEHIFMDERPILYVTRPEGDWCFLCGDEHPEDASSYRVVGMNHILERDQSLTRILDLDPNEEAERASVDGEWTRSKF